MDELLKLLLLFGVGTIAGFINIMAGGGSTLTLPTLIFIGLEGSLANGTNRVAIFIQNIFAVISFHQEKHHRFRFSLKLAAFTLPGAAVGAIIATKISHELFQKLLAYVLIGVIVEKPSGLNLDVFRSAGARMIGIPVDEMGMRVDILENLLSRLNPKFIYTIPTFQNPSGAVLSLERRKRLLDLAYKYQVVIIEDDPYSKLYYEDMPPPTLKSLDKHNHVIYLGTFSKILFPGLRIGWVVAPKELIEELTIERHLIDLHTNTLGQCAIHEFIKEGLFEKHLNKVQKEYAQRRLAMISSLKKYCSSHLSWNNPKGGFYLWCELNDGQNSSELLREAYYNNVAFVPGNPFFPDGKGEEWLRLNFTYHPEGLIEEGMRRLNKSLSTLYKKSKIKTKGNGFFPKQIV